MKKCLLLVISLFVFIGCTNDRIYLVGEIEDDYHKKPYVNEYKNSKTYPIEKNKYSDEL